MRVTEISFALEKDRDGSGNRLADRFDRHKPIRSDVASSLESSFVSAVYCPAVCNAVYFRKKPAVSDLPLHRLGDRLAVLSWRTAS